MKKTHYYIIKHKQMMRQSKDNHAEAKNRESEIKTRAKQTASDDLE